MSVVHTRLRLAEWITRLRWLAPLVPIVGYITTVDFFPRIDQSRYLGASLLAAAAWALFARSLRGPMMLVLPRWILFFVLMAGHYLQAYWLMLDTEQLSGSVEEVSPFLADAIEPKLMLTVFDQATYALAAVAVLLAVLDLIPTRSVEAPPVPRRARGSLCRVALTLGVMISAVTVPLMAAYGIGLVGKEATLPFRLSGWILNGHRFLFPGLMLLVLTLAEGQRSRRHYGMGLTLMSAGAIADALITTTRASILIMGLRYLILELVTDRLTRRKMHAFIAAMLACVLLFPFLSRLRDARAGGERDWTTAFTEARVEDADTADTASAVRPIANRLTGVNVLLPIVRADVHVPLPVTLNSLMGGHDISDVATFDVFGYSRGDKIGIAPSLLGWLYIAGGDSGQIWGMVVLVLVVDVLWRVCARLRWYSRPVLMSLLAVLFLLVLSEGTIDMLGLPLAVVLGTTAALELFVAVHLSQVAGPGERLVDGVPV